MTWQGDEGTLRQRTVQQQRKIVLEHCHMISTVPRPFGEDVHPWRAVLVPFSELELNETFEAAFATESVDTIAIAFPMQMDVNTNLRPNSEIMI